jgi:hypothetical protein
MVGVVLSVALWRWCTASAARRLAWRDCWVNWTMPKPPTVLEMTTVQLRDAAHLMPWHTAMFTSQPPLKESQHITLPSSFVGAPLTPPQTDEKAFTQAPRVIALLRDTAIKIRGHPFSLHEGNTIRQSVGLGKTSRYLGLLRTRYGT